MCRVSEYSHAISTSWARGASSSRRRRTVATACVQLAADEVHGGQLVERVALQAGVADPMGQLDGALGQVGVRRVELVCAQW